MSLLVTSDGNHMKIATSLLDPFLAHLKTSQDQVAKGGCSIVLKPEDSTSATWFTIESVYTSIRLFLNDTFFLGH